MRIVKSLLNVLLLASLFSSLTYAVTPDRISGVVTGSPNVTLRGNVHHKALPKYDQGLVDSSFRLGYVTLLTQPTASQQKALKQLLIEQQDPRSQNYHKWLTAQEYADRFGLSHGDVQKLTDWLKSQGFTIASVARGRNWIVFGGTASQMQSAFGTEIHRYNVGGEMHFANANAPRIPAALSGIVSGFRGLDDFRPKPAIVRNARAARPGYYDNLFQPPSPPDFLAPGDIATIYDIKALYTAGSDGTGQKLAIAGQTDVYLDDLNDFRGGFGLSQISGCTTNSSGVITACNATNFKYVLNGPDPGVSTGDLTEADLDLEWSGAVARNAQIVYINSGTANGVWDSWYYAVDNVDTLQAKVISLSYGSCEFFDNFVLSSTGQALADELELMKANTEGITFVNSSGDSGAAACDGGVNSATQNLAVGGLAVSYPASSPEVTGVGGTAVNYPTGYGTSYWGTANGTDGGSVLANGPQNGYVPEQAWNDDEELAVIYSTVFNTALGWQENYAIVATGGGLSNCAEQTADNLNCSAGFPKPTWQTVTLSGQPNVRFAPDVSMNGSPNFPGYIFCTAQDAWDSNFTSSTSTCSPGGTAGISSALTLTDPKTGNPAPSLVGGTSAAAPVFAGVVVLLNQYLGTGGLGNINQTLYLLAKTPANGAFHKVTTGDNNVYCEAGQPGAPWPVALQCPSSGVFGFSASNADATTGYNLVTGLGSVDANKLALAWADTLPTFSMSATALSPASVSAGNSTASTVTITPQNGFSSAVTLGCTGLPTGASCTFDPPTVAGSGTTQATINTLASTATGAATVTITGTAGAVSGSTTVSLNVTTTTQSFTLAPQSSSYSVAQGGTANVILTMTPVNGFNTPLTYTCSLNTAPESRCTGPTGATATTSPSFQITTTAPTTELRTPFGKGTRIFYAALLPGLLGIMFTAGSRKRSLRGMRMLGLIVVLGFSTLWLGSCGGTNSSASKDPGTAVGSYSVTITATTGGANPISNTAAPLVVPFTVTP